jgi:nitrogen PTS system EIIA component
MTMRANQVETSAIEFDIVVPSLIAANKKQVIRLASHEIAKTIGIGERILADRLAEQEKENPSAMNDGIAVTHLHISGLQDSINVFIRLKTPVDMGAPDKKDVDLMCLLLTPEREGSAYLRTMARISRLLRNAQICAMLRSAQNEKTIRAVLDQTSNQQMAA